MSRKLAGNGWQGKAWQGGRLCFFIVEFMRVPYIVLYRADEARFKGDVTMQQKVDRGLAAIGHHSQGENEWQTIVRGVAARTNSTPEGVETRLAQLQLPRTNRILARRQEVLPAIALADQPLQAQETA